MQRRANALAKELAAAQAEFRARVEAVAEKARVQILPFFKARGYDYRTGNGTWIISKRSADHDDYYKPEHHVEDEALPQSIRDVLTMEVGLHDCLGFYIRDINRGEW